MAEVKVKRFATTTKKRGVPPESWGIRRHCKYRELTFTENPNPDKSFFVIAVSNLQEGISDYVDSEVGYAWDQKHFHKAYVVANSVGKRFKVLPEDLELLHVPSGDYSSVFPIKK